ncbi:hypothetical protein RRG08_033882 [Elysia crispata]|uniref:Uncharacterized protein n=1 Tax=Elysia crispata TaxID=231223 RepID=A0AAE1BA93_9GAST|nr:hypothetical protein RRG08_033882 [Elysia crispata]
MTLLNSGNIQASTISNVARVWMVWKLSEAKARPMLLANDARRLMPILTFLNCQVVYITLDIWKKAQGGECDKIGPNRWQDWWLPSRTSALGFAGSTCCWTWWARSREEQIMITLSESDTQARTQQTSSLLIGPGSDKCVLNASDLSEPGDQDSLRGLNNKRSWFVLAIIWLESMSELWIREFVGK